MVELLKYLVEFESFGSISFVVELCCCLLGVARTREITRAGEDSDQGAFARVSSAPTLENENQDPGHRSGRRTPLAEIRLLLPSRLLILTSTRPLAFAFIVGSNLPHPAAMLV